MKLLIILFFIIAGCGVKGQDTFYAKPIRVGMQTIHGNELKLKSDTIKCMLLLYHPGPVPLQKKGWYIIYPIGMNCWGQNTEYLEADKKTIIPPEDVWNSKIKNW